MKYHQSSRMRTVLTITTAAVALTISAVGAVTTGHASAAPTSEPDFATIDSHFEEVMDDMRMPGASLAVVKDDQIVHTKAYGDADGAGSKVTPETPFMIGSTSKSFTAVAVMQLVEQGKIDLSAPVTEYVPWFRLADKTESDRITVRHLLTQQSGIPTVAGMWWAYEENTSDAALEDVVRRAENVKLTHTPGEKWQYSNLNYTTLGLVIQEVSGQSYEDYVKQEVLTPLGMNETYMFQSEAEKNGLATGHQFWFGMPFEGGGLANNRATTPTGLMSSTSTDMAKYLIAHLNGGSYEGTRILSPEGMTTLHDGVAEVADNANYAMGWIDGEMKGVPILMHNGDTGHFHTTMVLEPEHRWGVIVMMNGSNDLRQGTLDIPAYDVLAQLIDSDAPAMPGALEDPVMITVVAMLGATVVQLLGLVRSIVLVRRWRQGVRRPRSRFVGILRVGWPFLVSVAWAGVALLGVPMTFGLPHEELLMFDIGWTLIVSGGLALIWGVIVRPILAIRALRHRLPDSLSSPYTQGLVTADEYRR